MSDLIHVPVPDESFLYLRVGFPARWKPKVLYLERVDESHAVVADENVGWVLGLSLGDQWSLEELTEYRNGMASGVVELDEMIVAAKEKAAERGIEMENE